MVDLNRCVFMDGHFLSQLGIDPCPQNRKRKRLGNVVVSPSFQSVYNIQIGVIGSQQNNRNTGRVLLDLPEQLKPAAIRQIDIQQNQGYTAEKQLLFRRFQVLAGNDLPILCFQCFA